MRSGQLRQSFFVPIDKIWNFTDRFTNSAQAPRTLDHIQIARDQWGVPHVYAPTDNEVAFGLAWVQCEDDFKTVQEQLLAIRGHLGQLWGKRGIIVDFGIKFMGLREEVEARYDQDISPEFDAYLQRFADGINSYAALHKEEVLLKKLFPVTPKDIITGYLLGLSELTGARKYLESIINETVLPYEATQTPKGSNAFAFSKRITDDGKTYLAINSHQPLEGWYSWYEAHLMSDEGLNVLGGTFPVGVSILHGTNEHLGWAHTVNHPDLTDVYQLTMHPEKKNYYRFDGNGASSKSGSTGPNSRCWALLISLSNGRSTTACTVPTFKTNKGYFALRVVAALNLKAADQWYRMTKARNFAEFYECLRITWHSEYEHRLCRSRRPCVLYQQWPLP
jgi:acyl-homoserine-lactone acylase